MTGWLVQVAAVLHAPVGVGPGTVDAVAKNLMSGTAVSLRSMSLRLGRPACGAGSGQGVLPC